MAKCPECGSENYVCIMRMNPIFVYECECGRVFREIIDKSIET